MAHAGSDLTLRTGRTAAVPDGSRSLAPSQREPRLVAVGPGPAIPDQSPVFGSTMQVHEYPVQDGKIQPPLLPEETLQRDRLLDWLHAKVRGRLVLILADAGYGKTTLLADWTRRTRVRALWYRLDEHDRDWPVFIRHIVAAGREIDPGFAPQTEALLRELGTPLTDRPTVVRTLQGELQAWATTGTALVLDDWHAVDDVPEIRDIVRELILRGPDRLTVVIASRRRPTLPVARLRAIGEAAEISTDDLRFDRDETERLFRDSYKHPLERDLLDDLARTTDGWAATLRLVESAVRGRPREEVRAVIRSLSGRHGDLHDYLAEEVVGRMSLEQQSFVERCSILGVATAELAAVAAQVSGDEARSHLDAAESYGLLARRGRTGQAGRLFHPLVRTFLEGRLQDAVGDAEVRATHARVARAAEAVSWAVSGHHYAAAGLNTDVARVLAAAVPTILGSGAHEEARHLEEYLGGSHPGAWSYVLEAHRKLRLGDVAGAINAANAIAPLLESGDMSVSRPVAATARMNAYYGAGEFEMAYLEAKSIESDGSEEIPAELAQSVVLLTESMVDGDLNVTLRTCRELARRMSLRGLHHYEGISWVNAGWICRVLFDSAGAREAGLRAVECLSFHIVRP